MASSPATTSELTRTHTKLFDGPLFDLVYGVTVSWFLCGAILDSWAHANIPLLETFWTPWHAVLYSGMFAALGVLVGVTLLNRAKGAATWREAIPAGYGPAVLGAFGMVFAGGGDAAWHSLFGIEKNVDALFSPTHLMLILCMTLMALGPLRAMYHRAETGSFAEQGRLAFALILFYCFLMIVAQGNHFFEIYRLPLLAHTGQDTEQLFAATSFVLQSVIWVGCILFVLRRWTSLRFGFFTVVLTVTGTAIAQIHGFQLGVAVSLAAGLSIDVAYTLLRPKLTDPLSLRLFAAWAGAALPTFYLVGLRLVFGHLAWTIHMTIGSVIMCALVCWLLTYLIIPGQGVQREMES